MQFISEFFLYCRGPNTVQATNPESIESGETNPEIDDIVLESSGDNPCANKVGAMKQVLPTYNYVLRFTRFTCRDFFLHVWRLYCYDEPAGLD